MIKRNNCPNCLSQKSKILLDLSGEKDTYLDYLKIDYKNIKIFYLKCQECGLIYRNPTLDKKEKELLYQHYRDRELRKENKYEYFQRIISLSPEQSENHQRCLFLKKYLGENGSLLDVGSGAGVFLYTFKHYFPDWEILGI